jgi:hypothetical protein
MIYGRSAMLMLIACILLGVPSRGSEIALFPADPVPSLMAGRPESSTLSPHSPLPARRATLSHFTPWKTRIKIVLAETYQRIIEEGDLGPAILPGRLIASATSELVSCPLCIRRPLRC